MCIIDYWHVMLQSPLVYTIKLPKYIDYDLPEPLLLTWIDFNPSMDK